jgi:Ca-activated chloride channel family protein
MRFLWPDLLWLLLLVPALVAAYIYALRRKKKAAVRYASLMLVRDALGPLQGLRRHLPPALFLLAIAAALVAAARPTATVTLPADYLTIILAMDVSRSMLAADVTPNRISAAQAAAKNFVKDIPRNVRLGIVSFAATPATVQTVTENRDDLTAAIDRFQLQRGTATGSGLMLALAQLFPDAGIDVEAASKESAWSRYGSDESGKGAGSDRSRKLRKYEKKEFTAVAPGSYTSGGIILLSDGRRTTGPDPLEAAKMAADRGVRVYTVGFGSKTEAPGGIPGFGGGMGYFARLDEDTLKAVATITGGEYFHAGTSDDLAKVYQSLSAKFALESSETEVSALFGALASLLVVCAGVLSMLWFHRRA